MQIGTYWGENDKVAKQRNGEKNPKRKDMGELQGCLEYNIKVDPRELLRVWTAQCKRKQT